MSTTTATTELETFDTGSRRGGEESADNSQRSNNARDAEEVGTISHADEEPESSLPPADYGRGAYKTLLCCSVVQIPVWGFQLAYGIYQQEYESGRVPLQGDLGVTGIIGTTMTGIIYMSMPFTSALLTRFPQHRKASALAGTLLASGSLALSALSTHVWQLVLAQAVAHGLGAALLYTATMLELDTWFARRKGLAFAITLSAKAGVGAVAPFAHAALLRGTSFRAALFVWAGVVLCCGAPAALALAPRTAAAGPPRRARRLDLAFLKHGTPWLFVASTALFSAGYGLPPTYLPSYAAQVLRLSPALSSASLALLSAPSVLASPAFGVLADGGGVGAVLCCGAARGRRCAGRGAWRKSLSIHATTAVAGIGAAVPVFLLWGFSAGGRGSQGADSGAALLVLFSLLYGFFAGGFSATWSGVMKLVATEGAENGEAVDTGIVFGLLNGGRGVGYVLGGLVGVKLLDDSAVGGLDGYSSQYRGIIVFTGVSAVFGCLGVVWKWAATTLR